MPPTGEPNSGRFLSLGVNLAVGVGLGLAIGTWLDRKYGWAPKGALIGCGLGLAGGLYLLIKEALKANRD